MQPSDKPKFLTVLAGVHDFYGKEISEFAGQVWWQSCERYDLEQVTKALSAHLMDPERGQWMPKPSDLVRQLEGTQTDRSLVAWGKVLEAIRRVGAYSDAVFDDGLIHASIEDIGGWASLCRSEIDDLPHFQRRFCDSYRAYARRPDVQYPPLLQGDFSRINSLSGHATQPPALIGDAARAKVVLASGSAARVQITRAMDQALIGVRA